MLFHEGNVAARRDLTARVDLLAKSSPDDRSAILKSIPSDEGSRVLKAPDAAAGWLRERLLNLSVMYRATQAISDVLDIDALSPQILDLVFESIGADRGAILLKDESGLLLPKAVRWREGAQPDERMSISQTIVDYVLEQGEGVITTDAPTDKRFSPAQSIVDFQIREAICVPIQGRHTTLGVLYADIQAGSAGHLDSGGKTGSRGRFSQDQLMLMVAIGHQAGLAIENTIFYNDKIQAERLAAVGQTIATLSHHIKNILQGIHGGSSLIDLGLKEKDDTIVRRGWTIVEKNQTKIYNMVMDMLSFSKDREPALEPADLNETIGDVVELMQSRAAELGVKLSLAARPRHARGHDRPRRHPSRRLEHRHQRHRRLRGCGERPGRRQDRVGRRCLDRPDRASATTASASRKTISPRSFRSSPRAKARAARAWACRSRRRSSASTAARSSSPHARAREPPS